MEEIVLRAVHPTDPAAVASMQAYFDEIDARFADGFDPGDALTGGSPELAPPSGVFVVAFRGEEAVGCGGVQRIGEGVGEIKRMWVSPLVRGRGVGRRLLADLEQRAERLGYATVKLDTNSVLSEAVALYEAAGYVRCDRYNDNPYPDRWFEKALARADD